MPAPKRALHPHRSIPPGRLKAERPARPTRETGRCEWRRSGGAAVRRDQPSSRALRSVEMRALPRRQTSPLRSWATPGKPCPPATRSRAHWSCRSPTPAPPNWHLSRWNSEGRRPRGDITGVGASYACGSRSYRIGQWYAVRGIRGGSGTTQRGSNGKRPWAGGRKRGRERWSARTQGWRRTAHQPRCSQCSAHRLRDCRTGVGCSHRNHGRYATG